MQLRLSGGAKAWRHRRRFSIGGTSQRWARRGASTRARTAYRKFNDGRSWRLIRSGPLSTPWEHGPDLTPSPNPRGRSGPHFYPDLWPFGGTIMARATSCLELWPSGHITQKVATRVAAFSAG